MEQSIAGMKLFHRVKCPFIYRPLICGYKFLLHMIKYAGTAIPREYRNKTDVRCFSLTNSAGVGRRDEPLNPANFSAREYSQENLPQAIYPFQLEKTGHTHISNDLRLSGVGGTAGMTWMK